MVGLDGILILFIITAVAILSAVILWIQGAAYNKSQELKDWDVTVADGLDELEEQEIFYYCQLQIEQDKWCKTQCDHCKKYYKPLEDELKKEKEL